MMSSPPNQTARLARRAAGRIRLARTLRLAGRGLVVGAAAALVAAAAGKAIPLDQTATIAIAAVSAGVALLASAAFGLTRRVSDTEGAGRLDESLRLHDRFTTAVELSEAPHRSVFGELALADAEKRAGGVSPARLIPLRPDRRVWGAGVIGLVLAASVILFVPARQVEPAPAFASSTARQREAAGERIAEVAESLAPEPITDTDPAQGDPVTTRADNLASELDEIQDRLERGELDAEDALATAAERLEAAAEESEARAAESAQTERSLAEAAAAAAAQSGDETAELAESLASGDLSRASEAARRLAEQSRGMPPEARERIARDLDTLAESLERAGAEEPPPGPGEQSEGLDESLREQLRERVGDLTDEDAVSEALQQEGLDAEAASDLAERLARDERDRQRTERTREDLRRLRDAVERTAEDVREPEPNQSDPTQNEPAGTDPAQTDPADQSSEPQDPAGSDPTDSPPADGEQGEPGQGEEPAENPSPPGASDPTDQSPASEQGQDPGQEPGQETGQETGQEQGAEPGQQPAEGTDPKPASDPDGQQEGEAGEPKEPGEGDQPSDQPGEQPSNQQGEQPTDQPGTQPGEQSEQQPGEQPGESQSGEPASEDQPSGEQGQGHQQGQEPGQGEEQGQGQPNPDASEQGSSEQQSRGQDGEQGGEPPPDAGESGSGESDSGEPGSGEQGSGEPGSGQSGSGNPDSDQPRSLSEELDRLADRQRQRRVDEQRAAELRRKAQELLDDATPEERERLEEMAERLAQQNRLPEQGPTEPWDAANRTVDARDPNATPGDGDNEQVLAEWYNPEGDPADGVERGEASAQRLRDAAESAERAVEQQRVPPRYRRLVRDMYKRLQDRAAEREGAAPLAEQVEKKSDAPKKDDGSGGDGDD